jgi:rfaE bifunctional protein nucleotidyltransferase chain/domain
MTKRVTLKKMILIRKNISRKTVILATGVFDFFHIEHLRFLKKAKSQGDVLLVGVEPDTRVRLLKGRGRPVNQQANRLKKISAIKMVDFSFILPKNLGTKKGREDLIANLRPDIYAISANTPFQIEKQRIMKKFGGKLRIIHPYNPKVSTTKLINNKLVDRRKNKTNI